MKENSSFRAAIAEKAILYAVDAEKGEGIGIARNYRVTSYPTFLLTNAEGEIYDRWLGFGETESFTSSLAEAAHEPLTIAQRRRQFRGEPNAADALKIAELEGGGGLYGEALAWYARAEELGVEEFTAPAKFELVARGHGAGLFGDDALMEQARVVLKSKRSTSRQIYECVYMVGRPSRGEEDRGDYFEALKLGAKRLSKDESEQGRQHHASLMSEYCLHVKGGKDKAFEWKLKSMPEGWREDGNALNNVAWWCFENSVALDEAEELARKGVELTDGPARANVMDTLAEICNAKGDCGEALELIRAALAINPDNDYLQKQLVRFEKLFEDQKG